jgi:hypothetical protein
MLMAFDERKGGSSITIVQAASLFLLALLVACATQPATRESVEQAVKQNDGRYLEGVANGTIPSSDPAARTRAEQAYKNLKTQEINVKIEQARKEKNYAYLEDLVSDKSNPFINVDMKKKAASYVAALRQVELTEMVEAANKAEDIDYLNSVAADKSNPNLTSEMKRKAGEYAKRLTASFQQRNAAKRFAEFDAQINAAFEAKDSSLLRSLVSSSGAKQVMGPIDLELKKKAEILLAVIADPGKSVQACRNETMDPRVRQVPPAIQGWISRDPEKLLEPLVASLLSKVHNPFERVKLIHDWIADNIRYDVENFLSGKRGDNSWAGVLRNKKSVCEGYARLFSQMCQYAGITEKKISSVAKGYGYDPMKELEAKSNHAWNAVQILGVWYLVDATWDSGYLNYFGQSVKDYSSCYLFLDPDKFIYSHFPESEKDQLLAKPITFAEYSRLPRFDGRYFSYGIRALTDGLGSIIKGDGEIALQFECPENVILDASLSDMKNKKVEGADFVVKDRTKATVRISMPGPGVFKIYIFARYQDKPKQPFEGILDLMVENIGGLKQQPAFPLLYSGYYDLDCQVLGPVEGLLQKGKTHEFKVRAPGAVKVALNVDRKMIEFEKLADSIFTMSYAVNDLPELTIFALPKNGGWTGVLRYVVK